MKYNDLYWIDLNIYLEFRAQAELCAEDWTQEKMREKKQSKQMIANRSIDRIHRTYAMPSEPTAND